MKNQLDLIICIVAFVLMAVAVGVSFGTQPQPKQPAAAVQPDLSPPKLPEPGVTYSNGLGGGGGGAGGGTGRARRGRMGA